MMTAIADYQASQKAMPNNEKRMIIITICIQSAMMEQTNPPFANPACSISFLPRTPNIIPRTASTVPTKPRMPNDITAITRDIIPQTNAAIAIRTSWEKYTPELETYSIFSKKRETSGNQPLFPYTLFRVYYIIPIPAFGFIAGAGSGAGISVTAHSVVRINAAIDAAF